MVLAQSSAIARHVAREHGFYGETAHEAALIDQAAEGVADIVTRLVQALFLPEDKRAEGKASLLNEYLPSQFEIYSKLLEKNGNNGHLVGSKVLHLTSGSQLLHVMAISALLIVVIVVVVVVCS